MKKFAEQLLKNLRDNRSTFILKTDKEETIRYVCVPEGRITLVYSTISTPQIPKKYPTCLVRAAAYKSAVQGTEKLVVLDYEACFGVQGVGWSIKPTEAPFSNSVDFTGEMLGQVKKVLEGKMTAVRKKASEIGQEVLQEDDLRSVTQKAWKIALSKQTDVTPEDLPIDPYILFNINDALDIFSGISSAISCAASYYEKYEEDYVKQAVINQMAIKEYPKYVGSYLIDLYQGLEKYKNQPPINVTLTRNGITVGAILEYGASNLQRAMENFNFKMPSFYFGLHRGREIYQEIFGAWENFGVCDNRRDEELDVFDITKITCGEKVVWELGEHDIVTDPRQISSGIIFRLRLTLKFNQPVDSDIYYVSTGGYAFVTESGKTMVCDFEEFEGNVDKDDPTMVHFMHKNPDYDCYPEIKDFTIKDFRQIAKINECYVDFGLREDEDGEHSLRLVAIQDVAIEIIGGSGLDNTTIPIKQELLDEYVMREYPNVSEFV